MKQRLMLLVLSLIMFAISLWSYPIYKIGENFKGLDKNAAKDNVAKYIYNGTVSIDDFTKRAPVPKITKPNYRTYMSMDWKTLRLADQNGNTLWKTTTLYPGYELGDIDIEDISKLKEIDVDCHENYLYDCLLIDRKTKQWVLKKPNGLEVRLPKSLNQLDLYRLRLDDPWMFINCEKNTLTYAIVDNNGDISRQGSILCKNEISSISSVFFSPSKKDIFFEYMDENNERSLLFVSIGGNFQKDFPDIVRGNIIAFSTTAPDYAILNNDSSHKLIFDLKKGEIVADIVCECVDLTQVDNTLMAIIGLGPKISLIDVLNGKLIQDFKDSGSIPNVRNYMVTAVRISKDAKDIWFKEDFPDNTYNIKHFSQIGTEGGE